MPSLPDWIVNKPAKFLQSILFIGAVLCGLGAFGALNGGEDGRGLLFAAIAVVLLILGGKIKTTYNFKGGAGLYR